MQINNKFAYFPQLQMAENGVTVITDISKVEYSEEKDLNERQIRVLTNLENILS